MTNQFEKNLALTSEHTDKILEIIHTQMRNDENSLTDSDLQGVIQALSISLVAKTLKIVEETLKQ